MLALAQHLDDMAESMLMSQFHNGILRTMKACYEIKAKDLRLIRPFTYVREFQTNDFSRTAKYVHTPHPARDIYILPGVYRQIPPEDENGVCAIMGMTCPFPTLYHIL